MSWSSSIFSFDTLQSWPRPSRAALFAVGVLLVVRAVIGVATASGFYDPQLAEATIFASLEMEHRQAAQREPSVLLMGTSRMVDISESCVERALGLPRGAVRNASQLSPSFWRNAALLRRNPDLLRGVRVVAIDVLPLHFFGEEMVGDEVFLRHASLPERARVRELLPRIRAVADFALPVWSERRSVLEWARAARALSEDPAARRDALREEVALRKEVIWKLGTIMNYRPGDEINIVDYLAPDAPASRIALRALDELLDALPEDAVVVLATLPEIGEVKRRLEEVPEVMAVDRRFREQLAAIDDPRIRIVYNDRAGPLGLRQRDYEKDGVHFSPRGVGKLCNRFAEMIGEELSGR